MNVNIQTRDLDLVRFVAEDGSLTSAARRMHLSQPAISQRLARLQENLGAALFERRDGVMRATAVGDRLVSASKVVSRELATAVADINSLLDQRSQNLRVTTQCYTCYRWLPFVIRDMRHQHPLLNLDVVPDATDRPYDALENDRIDVAIVSNLLPESAFEHHTLFEDELYAVMSTEHPYARRQFLNPAQFSSETLVLYTGDRHPILDEILHPSGITPARVIEVRITEAIVELARSGQGIAVLAGWAFNDFADQSGLVAVRITRGGFRRTWHAVLGQSCAKEHAESFIHSIRETGKVMQQRSWRSKLRQVAGHVTTESRRAG